MTRIWKLIAAFAILQALAAVPAAAQTPPDSDLMALRFYIGEGNEQAVQSEIRRLQLQYPDWTPSEDLNEVSRDVPAEAIDEIYGLIATGDFDGARSLIDKTRQAYPAWSPTEELLQTLVIAEAQSRFTQAVDAGEANDAIRVARSNSALLRCERVNNAWLLAEQYQSVGDNESALAVYRSVLRSCDTSEVLIATLEKSAAICGSLDRPGRSGPRNLSRNSRTVDCGRKSASSRGKLCAAQNAHRPNKPIGARRSGNRPDACHDDKPKAKPTAQNARHPAGDLATCAAANIDGSIIVGRINTPTYGRWVCCCAQSFPRGTGCRTRRLAGMSGIDGQRSKRRDPVPTRVVRAERRPSDGGLE